MTFPSLDTGYRSKCCFAPIRIGYKKITNQKLRVKIWVCTKCKTRNVDIVPRDQTLSQTILEDSIPGNEFDENA